MGRAQLRSITAAFDASGNMSCQASTSATTCSGTQTGAQRSYDNEGRLSDWQNTPTSPTTTDTFLYAGEGQRVEQQVTTSGVTTTTLYIGSVEELSTTGSTTSTTTYYALGGRRLALAVNGTFSYLASDGQGRATVALDGSDTMQASTLYGPHGTVRYSSGTMPGTYGYTGQRTDATTGLDYYNARYYDASAGQFSSADTMQDGLNRYGYVHGNPTTASDPSGHIAGRCFVDGDNFSCPTSGASGCHVGCGSGGIDPVYGNGSGDDGSSRGGGDGGGGGGSGVCNSDCQDNTAKGIISIALGFGYVIAVGIALIAGCFGPWTEVVCIPLLKAAAPFFLNGVRDILNGINLLRLAGGAQVGDTTTLVIRVLMVVVDILSFVLGIVNVWKAIRAFGALFKSIGGLTTAIEDAFQTESYAQRIANATSDAQRAALKAAQTRLRNQTVANFSGGLTSLLGGILGLENIGPDTVDALRSLQEWEASH